MKHIFKKSMKQLSSSKIDQLKRKQRQIYTDTAKKITLDTQEIRKIKALHIIAYANIFEHIGNRLVEL